MRGATEIKTEIEDRRDALIRQEADHPPFPSPGDYQHHLQDATARGRVADAAASVGDIMLNIQLELSQLHLNVQVNSTL